MERKIKIIATNRRATYDYEILQTIEAGIVLQGTEVKSLRNGQCNLQDAYAGFKSKNDHELYLFNLHINPYHHGTYANHDPKRPRKLLVHLREAIKLKSMVQEKGLTIIPLTIYFSGHIVKVKIAVVKAKRKYDKRETSKKKEAEKEIKKRFVG